MKIVSSYALSALGRVQALRTCCSTCKTLLICLSVLQRLRRFPVILVKSIGTGLHALGCMLNRSDRTEFDTFSSDVISYEGVNAGSYAGLTCDVWVSSRCTDNSFKALRSHFISEGTDTSWADCVVNAIECTGGAWAVTVAFVGDVIGVWALRTCQETSVRQEELVCSRACQAIRLQRSSTRLARSMTWPTWLSVSIIVPNTRSLGGTILRLNIPYLVDRTEETVFFRCWKS